MNRCWFALYTKVRQERLAESSLRGKGFEAFLPLHRTRRIWSDRIKNLEVPLFSRYLFCRFKIEELHQVLTTHGVQYAVGFANVPTPVPDLEIAALEAIMRSGIAAQPWPFLQKGARVRIDASSLAGVEGILMDFRGTSRLVISITLLQRSVAVEIDRLNVTPVASRLQPHSEPNRRSHKASSSGLRVQASAG